MPSNDFKQGSDRIIFAFRNNPLSSSVEAGFERDKAKVCEIELGGIFNNPGEK